MRVRWMGCTRDHCAHRSIVCARRWSSIANYLAALVSAATFATVEMETPPPLDQLANLRRQAEKIAREETMYRKKAANWIGALAAHRIMLQHC